MTVTKPICLLTAVGLTLPVAGYTTPAAGGFPPDPGARTSSLQQALLTYNGLQKGPLPLVFDIG
jgi:hypothetical protein